MPHSTQYASEENNPLSPIPFCTTELNSYVAMSTLVTQCCANKVTKAELDGQINDLVGWMSGSRLASSAYLLWHQILPKPWHRPHPRQLASGATAILVIAESGAPLCV